MGFGEDLYVDDREKSPGPQMHKFLPTSPYLSICTNDFSLKCSLRK